MSPQFQNIPHFTQQTTFTITLASKSNVTLSIYNAYGELVKTILNESKPAGEFQLLFDAEQLPSGIYFYTLTTNEGTITKKMLSAKQ